MNSTLASKHQILWITDPWNTLDHPRDTTLRLMEESIRLGIEAHWADVKSIRLENEKVKLDSQKLLAVHPERDADSFTWQGSVPANPQDFSSIHYRTDPPVDQAYLNPLHLLALGLRGSSTEVVNPLAVLFGSNEKIEGAALGNLMATSLISCQWDYLQHFGKTQAATVLKPLHEAQSHGIELLRWDTSRDLEEARSHLEKATQNFTIPVMLQQYLEGIHQGETRIWFLDGAVLGWVKKMPVQGDFRVNVDQGSRIVAADLTEKQSQILPVIGAHLQNQKIRLAAVDLIEDRITDFNFTSPGLITQMESVLQKNLSKSILTALTRSGK